MKRIIIILLALTTTVSTQAQWFGHKRIKGNGQVTTIEKKVSSYDKIDVSGSFDVILFDGKEGNLSIDIENNLAEYLDIHVSGQTLIIDWENNISISHKKPVIIKVPVQEISGIELNGSGDVTAKDMLKSDDMTLKISGSGNISLPLHTNNLDVSIVGSGDVKVKGQTKRATYELTGSGTIDAVDCQAEHVEVDLSGSGDIDLYASKTLEADLSGSGSIVYTGRPEQEDLNVSGSGSIKMSK